MAEEKRVVKFSEEPLELVCEWDSCDLVENDMSSFLSHMNSHLNEIAEDDFQCKWKDCDAVTRTNIELCRHLRFHAFHTKVKCYGKNFLQRKKLPNCSFDSQSRNIIPDLPDSLCCCWKDCIEASDNPEVFYRHVDTHAEDYYTNIIPKPKIFCRWLDCKSSFGTIHKLKDHLRSHTQEKMMACPVCGGMFSCRTKFQDHILRQAAVTEDETQNYSFQCGYCYRKYISERLLRDHMRRHVNHYKCPYCAMTCPNPSALHTHITYRHTSEKGYSCQYCEYRCKYNNDLYRHMNMHNSEASYKCPVENCDYSSRSQTCVNAHVSEKHENGLVKPYKCHICDKRFSRGNYLTKHLTAIHHFHWPSGHCRFRYHRHEDGFYRLQTVRYESIELSEAVLQSEACQEDKDDSMQTEEDNNENEHADSESLQLDGNNSNNEHNVLMYIPNSNGSGDNATKMIASDVQSVILEVHDVGSITSSEIPPVVYLNLSELNENSSNNPPQTIHLIEKLNGKTVIQEAEVIASGTILDEAENVKE